MSLRIISSRNKLICTFNERKGAAGFDKMKNAFIRSLSSLKKCQDSEEAEVTTPKPEVLEVTSAPEPANSTETEITT